MATIEEKAELLDKIHDLLSHKNFSWLKVDKINFAKWVDEEIADLYYGN